MASEVTWQSNPPEKLLKERFHISTGFHPGQRDIIGDQPGYSCRVCGYCRSSNFPLIRLSGRMLRAATHFLEEKFLPRIEKRG